MKKAVVSYNFGNYDVVNPIEWKTSDWQYILFTDKELKDAPEGWRIVVLSEKFFQSEDPKRRSNQIKYSPFSTCTQELEEDFDLVVVLDANMTICGDMDAFVDTFCMSTMDGVFLLHPTIQSAYEDLDLCVELNKDTKGSIEKTRSHFESQGYPNKVQYFQTGVSIRRNTSAWRVIEYFFYKEYEKFSKRDQPMMNFLRWKYDVLDLNLIDVKHLDEYLRYEKHHFEDVVETA
jgi:hypothetical protein